MFEIKNNEKIKKESSLVQRKSERQAIFKFDLSSASGGAGGGKYNRIPAFVSMHVLLIRRSLEKFFQKNFRDDTLLYFGFAKVKILSFLSRCCASANQGISTTASCREAHKRRFILNPWILRLAYAQPLKMTNKALSFLRLRGASGAQGISAPASCREAHKRRFIFNPWILHFAYAPLRMTIPTIALLFSFNISPSFAADSAPTIIDNGSCATDSDSSCQWELDSNGKLSITGSGKIGNYYDFDQPWGEYNSTITSIDIGQGITGIGAYAFAGADKVTSVTIPEGVTEIRHYAFSDVTASIDLPDSVTDVGNSAYGGDVIMSDIVASRIGNWEKYSFEGINNVLCKGDVEKCKNAVSERIYNDDTDSCPAEEKDSSANCMYLWYGQISSVTESQCTGNYGWNGASCARKDDNGNVACAAGYAGYQGKCWSELPFAKKHWTPAEAAQWLHDGNDNFVVITFKK